MDDNGTGVSLNVGLEQVAPVSTPVIPNPALVVTPDCEANPLIVLGPGLLGGLVLRLLLWLVLRDLESSRNGPGLEIVL